MYYKQQRAIRPLATYNNAYMRLKRTETVEYRGLNRCICFEQIRPNGTSFDSDRILIDSMLPSFITRTPDA